MAVLAQEREQPGPPPKKGRQPTWQSVKGTLIHLEGRPDAAVG
jgi:hypothetical protein